MAVFTGSLVAQNTSVFLCDIVAPRGRSDWFANVLMSGTFGGGTVSLQLSIDGGVTKVNATQDGTATAATTTAAIALNLRSGHVGTLANPLKLYATVGAATNPVVAITVVDNR